MSTRAGESRPVRMVDGEALIDGRNWRYSVSDNLDASTCLLNVHGFFAGGGVYWRESTRLAARLGLRVINPSLPGFGGSEPLPWDDLRMATFASGLAKLLDHLNAPRAIVMGHSMGGAVVMQFAQDFPERTLGVIYRDGVATASWKERRGLLSLLFRPIVPDVGMALDMAVAFLADVPDLLTAKVTSVVATAAPDVSLNARAFTTTLPVGAMLLACDYTAVAERVARDHEVPVLPMWGRWDRIVPPRTGREFGELIGEPVHWVLGGHSWMIPRPRTQLEVLRGTDQGQAFLERTRARDALLRAAA